MARVPRDGGGDNDDHVVVLLFSLAAVRERKRSVTLTTLYRTVEGFTDDAISGLASWAALAPGDVLAVPGGWCGILCSISDSPVVIVQLPNFSKDAAIDIECTHELAAHAKQNKDNAPWKRLVEGMDTFVATLGPAPQPPKLPTAPALAARAARATAKAAAKAAAAKTGKGPADAATDPGTKQKEPEAQAPEDGQKSEGAAA